MRGVARVLCLTSVVAVVAFGPHASEAEDAPVVTGAEADGYELVWSDEFDVDGPPSAANWEFEHGFKRNNEAQWYQPQNAFCEDGLLVVEARREHVVVSEQPERAASARWAATRMHAEYTSASLHTRRLHDWLYGRFVMRARVPMVHGAWPAFWTLGHGSWPACGEIDVMECYRESVLANFVWLGRGLKPKWDATKTPVMELGDAAWSEAFHEWRMDWDKDSIELHLDDRLMNSADLSKTVNANPAGDNPFRKPQYLLVNLAIGGDNGGDPSRTEFPVRLVVDYVRVYQQRAKGDSKK